MILATTGLGSCLLIDAAAAYIMALTFGGDK